MALRIPVRFGVWYMQISTLSGPKSSTSPESKVAHDGCGVSRVPRKESVKIETLSDSLARSAARIVSISNDVSENVRAVERGHLLAHARSCRCRG